MATFCWLPPESVFRLSPFRAAVDEAVGKTAEAGERGVFRDGKVERDTVAAAVLRHQRKTTLCRGGGIGGEHRLPFDGNGSAGRPVEAEERAHHLLGSGADEAGKT
jgi:hypothetical protein